MALCIAALSAAPSDGHAQGRSGRRDIDTTFAFIKTGTVVLGNGSATIVVTGWDQPTIRVQAHSDDGALRFETTSSRVTVEPTRSHDDVEIHVMVPRGVRVVARTNSGDITVRETRGVVDAESSSGDVLVVDALDVDATNLSGDLEVRQITGTVNVTTNNGDCTVTDSKGAIEATSISGEISVFRSAARIVRARTTSGDVYFEGSIATDGRYEFVSHSGELDLVIPKDASAQIGVTTWSGTIDSEFTITLRPGFNATANDMTKRFSFTVGGGAARVTAETFSGDINITSRRR